MHPRTAQLNPRRSPSSLRDVRVAFYSHDSFGLGHLRRNLALAAALRERVPGAQALLVTGSPRALSFDLPDSVEVVKLPSVTKNEAGEYVTRQFDIPLEETLRVRKARIREAVLSFDPDLFVVDHSPVGLKGELLPLLGDLRHRTDTELVLGLRDILDDPDRVVSTWRRAGMYRVLESLYHHVWVYGDPSVFPLEEMYRLSEPICEKLEYLGYVGRSLNEAYCQLPSASQSFPEEDRPHLLGLLGGGGDGHPVGKCFLEMLIRGGQEWNGTLLTGPFLSRKQRHELAEIGVGHSNVQVLRFTSDIDRLIATSDAVVTMGGYNSLMETMSYGKRVLVVPRVYPRREQWLRASAFEKRGLVSFVEPESLTPSHLTEAVAELLGTGTPVHPTDLGVEWNGAARFAESVEKLLQQRALQESRPRDERGQRCRA